jgi:hypothetical protein
VGADDALHVLAEDLGLDKASAASRGRVEWRQVTSSPSGLVIATAGLHR